MFISKCFILPPSMKLLYGLPIRCCDMFLVWAIIMQHCNIDLWPLDLKTGLWVTRDTGNFSVNFRLNRAFLSRVRDRKVTDRGIQTDTMRCTMRFLHRDNHTTSHFIQAITATVSLFHLRCLPLRLTLWSATPLWSESGCWSRPACQNRLNNLRCWMRLCAENQVLISWMFTPGRRPALSAASTSGYASFADCSAPLGLVSAARRRQ